MKFKKTTEQKINTPIKKKTHWKLWLIVGLIFVALVSMAGYGVKSFFDKYYIVAPVQSKEVKLIKTTPTPTKKPKQAVKVIEEVYAQEVENPTDLDIARYIKSKDWDYETAIKVAKSENAWNSRKAFDCTIDNAGTNKDGSIDYGIFQVNNIHRKFVEDYYSRPFEEVVTDCYENIDVAYMIYERNGNSFTPWSAYNNLSYVNHTIINL